MRGCLRVYIHTHICLCVWMYVSFPIHVNKVGEGDLCAGDKANVRLVNVLVDLRTTISR